MKGKREQVRGAANKIATHTHISRRSVHFGGRKEKK